MKKKHVERTLLRNIQRTRNLAHSMQEEISSRLRMLDDFIEGSTHNAAVAKAMSSLSRDADQLRKTLEFLTTKERDVVTIAEALEAIRQQQVSNIDTHSEKNAGGMMDLERMDAMKTLEVRLADVYADVTKRVARDKKKLKWIQQHYGTKDADTGNGEVSGLQSKPPEGTSMLLDSPSSESRPSPKKEASSTSMVVASLTEVSSEQICTTPGKHVNEHLNPLPRPLTAIQPLKVPTQQDDKLNDIQVHGEGEVIEGVSSSLTTKDLGQVKSPDPNIRVLLVKSSDIVGYNGPGIFNQDHQWPSIYLDKDTMMDRVFDVVRSHLGLKNRGLMRLWVFEESSDGHFLPRIIVHGKIMKAKLSNFGSRTVVLFVQLAHRSQRLYTFNHSAQRLVFIKARDLHHGNVIVYGHHVIDCCRPTSHVMEMLQKSCLLSALCNVRCYVESSPGQMKGIQWTSESVFNLDLGRLCQHGVILWLTEEDRKDPVVNCKECCKINLTVGQSSFTKNCLEQVSSTNNFLNNAVEKQPVDTDFVNDECHEQVSVFSSNATNLEDSLSTCTSVEDTMWQVSPDPISSHMDLTNLFFQRAAAFRDYHPHLITHPFSDHPVLHQPQFIIPIQPHLILPAFPVVATEPAFVPPSDQLYWVDPTFGQPGPVYVTGESSEHVSVYDEQTYSMAESNYHFSESVGVLDCPTQTENVSSDPTGNEGDDPENGLDGYTLCNEQEWEESTYEKQLYLSPHRLMSVSSSQDSHLSLNINAVEFIPGSSCKNRDETVSDCSPSDSHITNNSPTEVQTSAAEDPQTPQEQVVQQNTTASTTSKQDSEISEGSEKCMEVTHQNGSTDDKHAETVQPSGAETIQSPQGGDSRCRDHEVSRQNSRAKRNGKEFQSERSQKSELKDGSTLRGRPSSFPTRPRGVWNPNHTDKKNQTYCSNRSEDWRQRTDNFHFFHMPQAHNPAQHWGWPRSDRFPLQRQGWSNMYHGNSRQRQWWDRDDRSSRYPSKRFSTPQHKSLDSGSRCQPALTKTPQTNKREDGSVTKSERSCVNHPNTCDATHRLERTGEEAVIPVGKSNLAARQQFSRHDRMYQLPRFAHLQHHKQSGGSTSRYDRWERHSRADHYYKARHVGHYSHEGPKEERSHRHTSGQLEPSRNGKTSTSEDLGTSSSQPLPGAEKDKSSPPVQSKPTILNGSRKGFIRYVGAPTNSRPVPSAT